eukprot:1769252-Amphidinium_carterae.1
MTNGKCHFNGSVTTKESIEHYQSQMHPYAFFPPAQDGNNLLHDIFQGEVQVPSVPFNMPWKD